MSTTSIIVALVILAAVYYKYKAASLDKIVRDAVRSGDAAPVIAALALKPDAEAPNAYNHTIRGLWETYQRTLALAIVRDLAVRYPEAPIGHYWLKQALTIEPDLAREEFDEAFLRAHFKPDVAAACGPAG